MSATAPANADRLEAGAHDALAWTIRAQPAISTVKATFYLPLGVWMLSRVLGEISKRPDGIYSEAPEKRQELINHLDELHDRLTKLGTIARQVKVPRYHRFWLDRLENQNEALGDVLETLFIAMDPGFRGAIDAAIREVKAGSGEGSRSAAV